MISARRFAAAAAAVLAGCQSYTVVQSNVFADDDGNVVTVDYGRSESDHVNTFVSPATGKEMDFKSKLVVKAHMPDGGSFKAWQCMNFLPGGTMYQTDDGEWKLLARGFSCIIYRREAGEMPRYREVFRGVVCDTSGIGAKKDERWRDVMRRGREYKKPKPVQK
ncbi:MAG: hypothetical protein J6T01_02665 [Kiritimatiellae bacterium]|nr:hypothetical protein [Kiritimatiellia bacterium]